MPGTRPFIDARSEDENRAEKVTVFYRVSGGESGRCHRVPRGKVTAATGFLAEKVTAFTGFLVESGCFYWVPRGEVTSVTGFLPFPLLFHRWSLDKNEMFWFSLLALLLLPRLSENCERNECFF